MFLEKSASDNFVSDRSRFDENVANLEGESFLQFINSDVPGMDRHCVHAHTQVAPWLALAKVVMYA